MQMRMRMRMRTMIIRIQTNVSLDCRQRAITFTRIIMVALLNLRIVFAILAIIAAVLALFTRSK